MQLMKPRYAIIFVLFVLFITSADAVSFTVTSTTATPNTARSTNSQYQIQLSAITSFSTNFDIAISVPAGFSLSSVTSC